MKFSDLPKDHQALASEFIERKAHRDFWAAASAAFGLKTVPVYRRQK